MKKRWQGMNGVLLAAMAISLLLIEPLSAQPKKACCIAGSYPGYQINTARPHCPPPQKEAFTMVIRQDSSCGTSVWGTITDSSGVVSNWKGTLTPSPGRCCVLKGSFTTSDGHTITFQGTFCRKLGKWQAKGTWEETPSGDPCRGSGTWQVKQS